MARPVAFLAALLALSLPAPRGARAAPPDGTIEADGARVEILGKPVRVGENIELPEGFIRVEEPGTEDENVGSFTVVPAAAFATAAPAAPARPAAAAAPPGAPALPPAGLDVFEGLPPDACRAERSAYFRELWKMSGIDDVRDPDALLEGLEGGGQGARAGFYWFALASDAFRPLAWSSDLRGRADDLARCVRAFRAASARR